MTLIPAMPTTWTNGQVLTHTDLNAAFSHLRTYTNSLFLSKDEAGQTVSVAVTFSAAPTFSAGLSITGTLTMTTAASKLVPGATSFSHRNNADSADNLLISDAGAVTIRAGLTVTSGGATITAGGLTVTAGGLTVSASGITVTGNSTITGTLGGVTTLTCTTVTATNLGGTLSTAAQGNVTSLGTLTGLTVSGAPTFQAGGTFSPQNTANIYLGTDGTTAKTVTDTRGWVIIPYVTSKPAVNLVAVANATSAICYDPSNKKMYAYSGSGTTWHEVAFT